MRAHWLVKLKGMLRLSRAERTLTLAIFLLFQAMLPSYANALSSWSGDDRLVLCTAHGLIIENQSDQSNTVLEGDTLCIVAQSGASHLAQAPELPQLNVANLGVPAFDLLRLYAGRPKAQHAPHAPRAPPKIS